MNCSETVTDSVRTVIGSLAVGFFLLITIPACSSDPKPMAQPTPDQVRGHADRGFDKLKQEEKEHGTQTPTP